jgi:NADP-reducing hydrogenase subunit HndB
MTPEKALEVVDQHLIRGQVVKKYTIAEVIG